MENCEFIFDNFLTRSFLICELENHINILSTLWADNSYDWLNIISRVGRAFYFESDILVGCVLNCERGIEIFFL